MNPTKALWHNGFQCFRSLWPQGLYISFFGIVLPQLAFFVGMDRLSGGSIATLKAMVAPLDSGNYRQIPDFLDLMRVGSGFIGKYLSLGFGLGFCAFAAYLAIIVLADAYYRGQPLPKAWPAFGQGVKLGLWRGIAAMMVYLIVLLFTQMLAPLFILLVVPGLMIPTLLVTEHKGGLRTATRALFLRYTQGTPVRSFAVFFHLVTLAAFFYSALALLYLFGDELSNLDGWFGWSRGVFMQHFPGFQYGWIQGAIMFVQVIGSSFVLCLLAAFTTSFYYAIKTSGQRLPEEGIAI